MAVSVVAVELRVGRPAGGRAATAVSNLSAVAGWLGWLLALAARAVAGRADLDSAWSVFGVSAIARAAARPGARPTPGCGGGDRRELGPQVDASAGAAADRRAARCAAHHGSVVVATLPSTEGCVARPVHRAGGGSGRNPGRISGGQALGTHTTSPWAHGSGRDWMTPSPLRGPPP